MIEVRIGILESPKELQLEFDGEVEALTEQIASAVESGSGILWLSDQKGRRVGIPAGKLAYVEMIDTGARPLGFGAVRG